MTITVQHIPTKQQGILLEDKYSFGWWCVQLKTGLKVWDEAYQWRVISRK